MATLLSTDASAQLYGNGSSDLSITDLTTQLATHDGISIAGLSNQVAQDTAQISQAAALASQAGTLQASISQVLDSQANGLNLFSNGNVSSLETQVTSILANINGFISSLNTAGQTAQANGLNGQGALTGLAAILTAQLNEMINDPSLTIFKTADSVGIQEKNGVFSLNVGALSSALAYNSSQVQTLLTGNGRGTTGLLGELNNTLQNALAPTNGLFAQLSQTDTLNISSSNDEINMLKTYGNSNQALLMSAYNVTNQLITGSFIPYSSVANQSANQASSKTATYQPPKNNNKSSTTNNTSAKTLSSSATDSAQANKL